MNEVARRAELIKLGAILGIEPEQFGGLCEAAPQDIAHFRDQVNDMLFRSDRKRLAGIARFIERLPDSVVAGITASAIPPRLAARVAGVLDLHEAVNLVRRLPSAYIADAMPYVDPRQVRHVAALVRPELAVSVAAILRDRGDFISLGRMLSYLADDVVGATVAALPTVDLIQACFVLEDPFRMTAVVESLPGDRLHEIFAITHRENLWVESTYLAASVDPPLRTYLFDVLFDEPEEVANSLIAAATAKSLWPVLLAVSADMSERARHRFAELPILRESSVAEAIVRGVVAGEQWDVLARLVPHLPPETAEVFDAAIAYLSKHVGVTGLLEQARAKLAARSQGTTG